MVDGTRWAKKTRPAWARAAPESGAGTMLQEVRKS